MATLTTNSTFLPVLDDLLSPDFRNPTIPGQTPQTPAETPVSATARITFAESHTGQLTSKASNYPGIKDTVHNDSSSSLPTSIASSKSNGVSVKQRPRPHRSSDTSPHTAAFKIQQWWKIRKGKISKSVESNGVVDIRAERAKHTIRHNRTEDHIRNLETEVQRLKVALSTERKLRSLQVEAIRSLWSQVQKVSSISSPGDDGVMSQSMPNGLPSKKEISGSSAMSMSLHSGIGTQNQAQSQSQTELPCSCSKEIQTLRESFSTEMVQLRSMIDQLKVDGGNKAMDSSFGSDDFKHHQKRPLTLNLIGGNGRGGKEETVTEEKKEEIAGYANQMASSIIETANDKDEVKE